MALNSPLPYIQYIFQNLDFFFNSMMVNQSFNNSITLGSLAIYAQAVDIYVMLYFDPRFFVLASCRPR